MSFFKDFKEDLSQAVDELIPDTKVPMESDDMVNTLDEEVKPLVSEPISSILEAASQQVEVPVEKPAVETIKARTEPVFNNRLDAVPSDEVTMITAGTRISGDLESQGSIEIQGAVNGNVVCEGKLVVTGMIRGNSRASEFFADSAKIEGEIDSNGTVKVGLGSVIVGNITANSAVIAGAVKGDIDVQGPVVIDTSAVIMGNIKSRSVQINNGAVIEGFCSQCYAEIDVASLFESAAK
ncbi:bactofilin family protein [Anaerosacchariphilus polymeriproducens]|uniref:Polymer-forming cytoskeletal protein n=1 Tax=Anaerosacchariphilus polymeriproducens TaxID=1812858 RepID=A0A371AS29_9FIRM|nr:polymer-forming cytoskeletal protein [Anaerosacchariphilus polymeriproducens]RDU22368.1 polymer-forming cytoskeletal protein [Anaerosacchariphilus polymeriproducens]